MWFTQSITVTGCVWILFFTKSFNKKNKPFLQIHNGSITVSIKILPDISIQTDTTYLS